MKNRQDMMTWEPEELETLARQEFDTRLRRAALKSQATCTRAEYQGWDLRADASGEVLDLRVWIELHGAAGTSPKRIVLEAADLLERARWLDENHCPDCLQRMESDDEVQRQRCNACQASCHEAARDQAADWLMEDLKERRGHEL